MATPKVSPATGNGVLSPIEIGDPSGGRKVRAQITACLILTILATFDFQTIASADNLVKFDSAAYRVGQLQQRQARERGETPPEGPHTTSRTLHGASSTKRSVV